MKRDYRLYIEDILEAMNHIKTFTDQMDYEDFVKDVKTVYAVTRAVEIIGEGVKNIPTSIRDHYPTVPWREMAGMRDKLAHEYFGVNLKVLWDTVKSAIPIVKPFFQQIMQEINDTSSKEE